MRSIHIRAVDGARRCGHGGPQALVAIAEVSRRHEVSIMLDPAVPTPDPGLPPPGGCIDVAAGGAAPAGVAGVDGGPRAAGERRLGGEEAAQPPEAPRAKPPPAVATPRLRPVPDGREGLEETSVSGGCPPW